MASKIARSVKDLENIDIVPSVPIDGVIRPGDDRLYFDPVLRRKYYNYYFSYGRYFRPTKVYEMGVRTGYTAYYILSGAAGSVKKYRGIDLESYLHGSSAHAMALLSKVCSDVRVHTGNSHALKSLDDCYDLIHVDGDHTYGGKLQDLRLALDSLAPDGVIVVDDCSPIGLKAPIYKAVKTFVAEHDLKMRWFHPLCGSAQNAIDGHALLMRPPKPK